MTDNYTKTKRKPKPIGCNQHLIDYVKETLRVEKIKDKKNEGGKITATDERDIAYNADTKLSVLNKYIFPSMANLIYFFEFIEKHPEFIERFEDDIEDLFGLKSNSTNPKGSPIARLVKSILGRGYGPSGYDDSADSRFYFRRRVLCILQFMINEKLKFYALHSPKGSQDARFFNMICTDLERTDVWANYLDKYMTDGKKNPKRVLNIDA